MAVQEYHEWSTCHESFVFGIHAANFIVLLAAACSTTRTEPLAAMS